MRIARNLSLVALVAFAAAACAAGQGTAPAEAPPAAEAIEGLSLSATQVDTITAVVEAIDYDTREVTLVDDMGDVVTLTAGEGVRNLNQVSVGDVLIAEHVENITVEVFKGDGRGAEQAEMFSAARAEEGEMPGGVAIESVVVVAVVKAINLDDNTFVLEGPDGSLQEYQAMNPDNLRRAEVGDIVAITMTESLAIAVEKSE
ncbi:hypothetical protein [Thioalkalivibrio sp. XN279]|uniref:hypothetical protein n=1 Tax=Thioalkalivibrio sp. XN279 TaxID=2714953 RepID=UPI00140CF5FF|nr:hypothetical protein [Thioalkalivibrio sp. XN279]NHA15617.1 hypothetical protein [Thioalkalivibrio sp. XN279]